MQSLLRLLRTRFVRLAVRVRRKPVQLVDPSVPRPKVTAQTTILSYDSFR